MAKAKLETTRKQDLESAQKAPPAAGETASRGALKARLRASSFSEGDALVAAGASSQAAGKRGSTKPARPTKALPSKDKGADATADKGAPANKDKGADATADKGAPANKDPWCDPALDDPNTVAFLAAKNATPDKAQEWVDYAWKQFERVVKGKRPEAYKRFSKVMADEDIAVLMLYTSQAAYAMNAVLRGQVKSKAWLDAWGPLVAHAEEALKKAPKGARNQQFKTHKDDPTVLIDAKSKGDKIVPFKTVHRNDGWNGAFEQLFATYQTGATLDEPGFLSTTLVAGSYRDDMPVHRTIEDVKVARSIAEVSALQDENEVLFPPGQRFQVTSMELEDKSRGARFAVKSGTALYPKRDGGPQAFNRSGLAWHIKLKHVGVAKPDAGKKPNAAADDAKKTKDKDKKDEGGGLLGLFGL